MYATTRTVGIGLLFLSALVWGSIGWSIGYVEGKIKGRELEAAERTEYVDGRMEAAGFCGWVRQSTFVQRCLFQIEEK